MAGQAIDFTGPNYHFIAVVSGSFKLHSGMIWGTCGVTQRFQETISNKDHQAQRAEEEQAAMS